MKNNIPKELSTRAGIYEIKNLVNGKVYIGCTNCFRKRYANHIYSLNNKRHFNSPLSNDFLLFGDDNFSFNLLYILDKDKNLAYDKIKVSLKKKEVFYIKQFRANNPLYGYNQSTAKCTSLGAKQRVVRNGENCGATKLKLDVVIEVKILLAKGWNNMQIVKLLNLKPYMATVIKKKRAWGHVEVTQEQINNYMSQPKPNLLHPRYKLSTEDVIEIKELLGGGMKRSVIARKFNVTASNIDRIANQ